jgi:hypothetical protein
MDKNKNKKKYNYKTKRKKTKNQKRAVRSKIVRFRLIVIFAVDPRDSDGLPLICELIKLHFSQIIIGQRSLGVLLF